MILESVQTEGIAELSYLIGDDKTPEHMSYEAAEKKRAPTP